MKLAGVILAQNEARHITDCIDSLRWTDEVVVFESGSSTDDTVALASEAGATVISHRFENFAQQRNAALKAVDADWILFVDADERVSDELRDEIQNVLKAPQHVGYYIPRHNYIFGTLTRHTGWYPDYQMRLLRRDAVEYDPAVKVHEVVNLLDGSEPGYLEQPLIHYNYDNIQQFIRKQHSYAQLDAQILYDQDIRPRLRNFVLQPLRQFHWRFFTLDGYKDGLHGLWLSLLMGWNEFDKYRHLRRLWQSNEKANKS